MKKYRHFFEHAAIALVGVAIVVAAIVSTDFSDSQTPAPTKMGCGQKPVGSSWVYDFTDARGCAFYYDSRYAGPRTPPVAEFPYRPPLTYRPPVTVQRVRPPVYSSGDLDCADMPTTDFYVGPYDPNGFDADGDGIGCES
jgi:hypothetical protein